MIHVEASGSVGEDCQVGQVQLEGGGEGAAEGVVPQQVLGVGVDGSLHDNLLHIANC